MGSRFAAKASRVWRNFGKRFFLDLLGTHAPYVLGLKDDLAVEIVKRYADDGYCGPIGIDAFFYFDKNISESVAFGCYDPIQKYQPNGNYEL